MSVNANTSSLSKVIISVPCGCFSSFELREPKQLLMLLRSLFLFIFLLPDFTLDLLTENCAHHLFIFASTVANFIEMIATYASLLQYEFYGYSKIRSRI